MSSAINYSFTPSFPVLMAFISFFLYDCCAYHFQYNVKQSGENGCVSCSNFKENTFAFSLLNPLSVGSKMFWLVRYLSLYRLKFYK